MLMITVMLYFKFLKKGKAGESYNVGSNINITNIKLVRRIIKKFLEKKVLILEIKVKIKLQKG